MESAAARRRRRRRRWRAAMLWLLTAVTTAVLLLIAGFVREISKVPTVDRPAALTATAHHAGASPSARHKSSPVSVTTGREVTDGYSGLSYPLLVSPWVQGCPGVLHTPVFTWTAGEHALAGQVTIGGTVYDWHGNACSGRLSQGFTYSGPLGLQSVTMSVANAVEPAYYSGLVDHRTIQASSALQVSGHQAWVVRFLMTYPHAAAEHLAWTSEAAAVVVVDRGAGQAPAVFYTSVPSNLGTSDVSTLVSSLRLSPG